MLAIITPYFLPSKEDKEKVFSHQADKTNIINERKKEVIQYLIAKNANINAKR